MIYLNYIIFKLYMYILFLDNYFVIVGIPTFYQKQFQTSLSYVLSATEGFVDKY